MTSHALTPSELTPTQKTAILLLALEPGQAQAILRDLDTGALRAVAAAMAALGPVPAATVQAVLTGAAARGSEDGVLGAPEAVERLLLQALPAERAVAALHATLGDARSIWDQLSMVDATILASYLKNEYPQTVALVLSRVGAPQTARVLALLPESFAMECLMRMLRIETVQPEVVREVELVLAEEFVAHMARATERDRHELLADVFNHFDTVTSFRFMAALEARNRESAERIKALMFTFEDLARLDAAAAQSLLRNVDKTTLATALKGASETVKDLFFANMSERAGKILREEMASMGPIRVRDVDAAQTALVRLTNELAARGELAVPAGSGDDALIY